MCAASTPIPTSLPASARLIPATEPEHCGYVSGKVQEIAAQKRRPPGARVRFLR
jgi:hypothetical protein